MIDLETEPPDTPLPPAQPTDPQGDENRGILRNASLLAVGNVVSRVLGLFRDTVMTHYFSGTLVSAYENAVLIPNNLFDAVKTGMVDSALVPVFTELSEDREALWSAVSAFLSVLVVLLIGLVIVLEIFHKQFAVAIGAYELQDPVLTETTLQLMRLAIPAVLFLSVAGVMTALLYSLKRFTIPAFLPAIFNGTIVVAAIVRPQHVSSLVYGLLIGSVLQIVAQWTVLRGAKLRWNFNPRHPAIGRIIKLFTPIIGVLLVDQVVRFVSYNLANRTGDASLHYMRRATTLLQFPMGLVVTALSIAILPVLSKQAGEHLGRFKETLSGGLRLVLILILPATAGLFALALPVVDLLFGSGESTPTDVANIAAALQVYLIGLPFAAVDQMLIFGSYARRNTLSPSIVGIISMIANVAVAISLLNLLGLFSLMVADATKHIIHTILMLILLWRQIGGIPGYGVLQTLWKAGIAAILTGVVAYFVANGLRTTLPVGILSEILTVAGGGISGVAVYVACVFALDITDAKNLILYRSFRPISSGNE